ncbi:family 78 glycoside hydrolase catalytic domain [Microbacterium sp. NPDC058389]|uniref:family 78 glycoside hydrolase catalytic domain n=1 Tax=Microbacterium sp. NPDC058389 TaxID=3346475 RepID=UPI00365B608A
MVVTDGAGEVVWTSGAVAATAVTVETVVAVLQPRRRYDWALRVRGADGTWTPWASSAFETGPADFSDWTASWITLPARTRLRRTFALGSPVDRARVYLTGQGLVRAELNGTAVNADHLDPTRTDTSRALYRVYDVTDLLTDGLNTLEFVVAAGEWKRAGLDPRLLAELVVWHADGTSTTIVPDASSTTAGSRIAVDEPFYLERHDPLREAQPEWRRLASTAFLQPDGNASSHPASPPARVEADATPPTRVVSRRRPVELSRGGGIRLFDVGTNVAGRTRLELFGALTAGTVVRLVHGEHVGADGRLDTTNLMMPFDHGRERQVVEWVSAGVAGEVVEAWFAYHGFRYVEVQGVADDLELDISVGALHTDLAPNGGIRSDSDTIGALLTRAERTLLNNVHGVPEDCPTREQAAWTGDTASVAEYELAAFHSENFLSKWIRDLVTSQGSDGGLPAVAPDVRSPRLPADPVWGAALHRLLIGHWLHYGDAELVREVLPALRRWARFQLACIGPDGVISRSPISYGHDWLGLEQTPPEVHHTAATIDCLRALVRLEADFGDADAAATWSRHAHRLQAGARSRFYDESRGVFANGSQGAYACAIDAGILTGPEAERAAQRIEDDVRARGNRISGGFATTRTIVRALASTGRSQVIADMLEQPTAPGIGAMLASGPGTFWECWWIDPTNTGTGSLDHVGLGGVFAGWAWEFLAGLTPTSGGYRSFDIAPQFVAGVEELDLHTETPVGGIRFAYRISGDAADCRLDVPHGAVATVVDGQSAREYAGGHHEFSLPVRRTAAVAPPATEPWVAPSIAPVAADVTGPRDLLTDALRSSTARPADNSRLTTLAGLNCMPIPHAQPAGAVVEVTPVGQGPRPAVRIDFSDPLDGGDASFAYALVDLCDDRWQPGSLPRLRVISTDGSARQATAAAWPAGWVRVAVDLDDWPGRSSIAAVEISTEAPPTADDDPVMPRSEDELTGGFHLGEVGISTARRTW